MITVLLILLLHHLIHYHLLLFVILHVVLICTVDLLFRPLQFFQSRLCPLFLLVMHTLQVSVQQEPVLLLECLWPLHRIHLMLAGGSPVNGSWYPSYIPCFGAYYDRREPAANQTIQNRDFPR